eukprot:TRINITY_DN4888_c0_g4_i1.p1 TRINITY_DN4888_c0_g4~~TRINITY_DN4888_c0_g4_i1.p1  ORF type:complete len:219 (+),score=32.19 TRINITY_DN4888_c0_g4_i1:65-721(+)
MSKTFSTSLYEVFEANGALKMRADNFLTVLRRAGATISLEAGKKLVRYLGMDSEGYVDVRKFSSWFEGIEQEPRFAQRMPRWPAPGASESMVEAPRFGDDGLPCAQPSGESLEGSDVVHEAAPIEVDVDDNEVGVIVRQHDEDREGRRRTLSFDRQVTSDDGSEWPLDDEDKYTLPQRRRLSEHEKLKARFIATLNKVKARLEASPVIFRPELRAQFV